MEEGVHFLEDGHHWEHGQPLPEYDEDDVDVGDAWKPPSRLRFSRQPITVGGRTSSRRSTVLRGTPNAEGRVVTCCGGSVSRAVLDSVFFRADSTYSCDNSGDSTLTRLTSLVFTTDSTHSLTHSSQTSTDLSQSLVKFDSRLMSRAQL